MSEGFVPAVGIDLGTSKCCVAVVRDGKVEVIENERGSKTTPSYVAFTDTERLIGEAAKDQVILNPTNTVFGVKRILGRSWDDPALQKELPQLPFEARDEGGRPSITVSYRGEPRTLSPEQVTAMLLTKMKQVAEQHLGCSVTRAVVSVPASFDHFQRQAILDAAAIAGLEVLGLINEPTAAAVAYADSKKNVDERLIVFDFGGGKLDISVIDVQDRRIIVKETWGNPNVGGMDLDWSFVKQLADEFCEQRHNIWNNSKALEKLRLECEGKKHTLSLLHQSLVQLISLADDVDFETTIDRQTLKNYFSCIFKATLVKFSGKAAVFNPGVGEGQPRPREVDRIVLVGGSTRVLAVQDWLKEHLSYPLDRTINPDEAVACGAALWAAVLGRDASVKEVEVRDVLPYEVVCEGRATGITYTFFPRMCSVPAERCIQAKELANIGGNIYFWQSYPHTGKEKEVIQVTAEQYAWPCRVVLSLTPSGVLSLSLSGNVLGVTLNVLSGLKDSLLRDMHKQEKQLQADASYLESVEQALNELENCCFRFKTKVEGSSVGAASEREEFVKLCEDTLGWIDSSQSTVLEDYKDRMLILKLEYQRFDEDVTFPDHQMRDLNALPGRRGVTPPRQTPAPADAASVTYAGETGAGYGNTSGAGYGSPPDAGYGSPPDVGYGNPSGTGYGNPSGTGYGNPASIDRQRNNKRSRESRSSSMEPSGMPGYTDRVNSGGSADFGTFASSEQQYNNTFSAGAHYTGTQSYTGQPLPRTATGPYDAETGGSLRDKGRTRGRTARTRQSLGSRGPLSDHSEDDDSDNESKPSCLDLFLNFLCRAK